MSYFKLIGVVIVCGMLAACASTKKTGAGANGDGSDAQSSGLGINAGFNGTGADASAAAKQQELLAQKTILFGFNKTDIDPQYVAVIEAHANYLRNHHDEAVLLAGNTDEQGSREYNMGLGERRAQSVADVLMSNGIVASQITKISYGPEIPVACGQSDAAYAKNRRVDILYGPASNCQTMAKKYAQEKMWTNNNS
jgi:peptidoglycan-associated lipoprotein